MAGTVKRLQVRRIVGIAVPLERYDVIAFQPPGPATVGTAPTITLKDGAAYGGPAAGIQVGVVETHSGLLSRGMSLITRSMSSTKTLMSSR